MRDFTFYAPTRVVFGQESVSQTGELIRAAGGRRVLLHYGGGSAVKSGLLDRVCRCLDQAGLTWVTLGGVRPNPRLSLVREGIALGRKEQVDFVLAVGGGSVIDSAKAIAYGLAAEEDRDVWDFYARRAQATACLPLGAVVTIAAAGSECSASSVITNDQTGEKRGYSSDLARCRFAVMDPTLTCTLPPYQTACGCTDIMMHMMERYFHPGGTLALCSDGMTEALLRSMLFHTRRVMADPMDLGARGEIMWMGTLAHNDMLQCGNGSRGDWACHQLQHELGGRYDVTHGAGLAAIWPAWARYVCSSDPARFAAFARRVMGVEEGEDRAAALAGIDAFTAFLREIGMPVTLGELGLFLSEEDILALARGCSFQGTRTVGTIRPLDEADMAQVYRLAR